MNKKLYQQQGLTVETLEERAAWWLWLFYFNLALLFSSLYDSSRRHKCPRYYFDVCIPTYIYQLTPPESYLSSLHSLTFTFKKNTSLVLLQ